MSTYEDIRSGRRMVWTGIALGYGVAIAISLLNIGSGEGSLLTALAFLLALSIPSTLAIFSLDRRPSLLVAAGMAALLQGFLLLGSGVGLLNVLVAILWYLGGQRRPRPAVTPSWATWIRPLIGLAAILPIFALSMHLDPRCTSTDRDGNVTVEEATEFPSGWRLFTAAGYTSSTSSTASSDTVSTVCSSDTIQPWEAGISIVLSAGLLTLISRWPTTGAIGETRDIGSLAPAEHGT